MQINVRQASFNTDDVVAYTEEQELLPAVFKHYECSPGGYYKNPTQTNLVLILKDKERVIVRDFSVHDYRMIVDSVYSKTYKREIQRERILSDYFICDIRKERSYSEQKVTYDIDYKKNHPILFFLLGSRFEKSEQFEKLLKDYRIQKLVELDKE